MELVLKNTSDFIIVLVVSNFSTQTIAKSMQMCEQMQARGAGRQQPLKVYIMKQEQLKMVETLVNRLYGEQIFDASDKRREDIEIYLKTPYSDDLAYFESKYQAEGGNVPLAQGFFRRLDALVGNLLVVDSAASLN